MPKAAFAASPAGFDWTLVRSFLAALEHGSLLAGARALGLSQPTLGRHIAELEAQLGVVCPRRTNFDPPCRLNFDPGLVAGIA